MTSDMTSEAAEPAQERPAPGEASPAPLSRAGRNVPVSIVVALVLGAAVLVSLLTVRQIFVGVVAVAVAVGTWELVGALKRSRRYSMSRLKVACEISSSSSISASRR